MSNNYPTQASGELKPETMTEYAISGSNIKLVETDGDKQATFMDAEAVVRVLDLIERVSRAEAERDELRQQLAERDKAERCPICGGRDKISNGLKLVCHHCSDAKHLEQAEATITERDATIARLKTTVSDEEVHLFSEIAVVYTRDGAIEEFNHFDRHAIDELLAHRYAGKKEGKGCRI